MTADGERHHIIDPRTATTAATSWAQVTCAGPTAVDANAASTAAIVLDGDGPAWLTARRVPARLESRDGRLTYTCGWPEPADDAEGTGK